MKILGSIESTIRIRKGGVKIGDDNRVGRDDKCEFSNKINNSEISDNKVEDNEIGKKDQKIFKSKNLTKSKNSTKFQKLSKSKKTVESLDFFILRARLAFIKLR